MYRARRLDTRTVFDRRHVSQLAEFFREGIGEAESLEDLALILSRLLDWESTPSARWIVLAFAIMAVLTAIFFDFAYDRLVKPWIELNERNGRQVPAMFRSRTFGRAWNAGCAVLFFVVWWFLGTLDG